MDTKHQFVEDVEAFARIYVESRAVASRRSTALEIAAVFLAKDPNAKSPAILAVEGFTKFLERHGITPPMFKEALTAARKEADRVEAERVAAESADAPVTKPRKVRKPATPAPTAIRPHQEPAVSAGPLFITDTRAGDL
ncbi:hypothetical protein [Glacieibacterium frigidum]|uniref:Uncharacterized protein n=1 Tax=Glacieibacterium frigidum TaxID=2593303 RepID=A0A552UHP1_9SPHN|nr:hypothetical protein [Glacieibacterium frigidum]TRW17739.1 hypothetical protein FMM06_06275 [Glacieibacterium frigidum]